MASVALGQRAIAPLEENQRLTGLMTGKMDDPAYDDGVIAGVVEGLLPALEIGQRIAQGGGAQVGGQKLNAVQMMRALLRQPRRHSLMSRTQDADCEGFGLGKGLEALGPLLDAPKDQRRIEGHGGERIHRYADMPA